MNITSEHLNSYEKKMSVIKIILTGINSGNSRINSFIISGSPGIGKSYQVKKTLEGLIKFDINNLINSIKFLDSGVTIEADINYQFIRGHITPFQLFKVLAHNNKKNFYTIFDDTDSVFNDIESMNLLKAATDTTGNRRVRWNGNENNDFLFEGNIIILTNYNFTRSEHHKAMLDRMFHYDLNITEEERIAKIIDIATKDKDIGLDAGNKIVDYILRKCANDPNKITLRTFVKVASLYVTFPEDWEFLGESLMIS